MHWKIATTAHSHPPRSPTWAFSYIFSIHFLKTQVVSQISSRAENLSQMTFKPRNHHFWQAVNSEGITPQNKPGSTNKGTKNKTSKETVIWMGMNFINKTTYFNSLYSSYKQISLKHNVFQPKEYWFHKLSDPQTHFQSQIWADVLKKLTEITTWACEHCGSTLCLTQAEKKKRVSEHYPSLIRPWKTHWRISSLW